MKRLTLVFAIAAAVAACAGGDAGRFGPEAVTAAADGISGERFLEHVRVLSSDKFEGRAPGTEGEALTVEYLSAQFAALGLKPGNPDGRWVQDVPLVGITGTRTGSMTAGGKRMRMNFPQDYVSVSRRFTENVNRNKDELDRALQVLPIKLNKVGRTAIYGSWFNFYLCHFKARVKIPGATVPINYSTGAARCDLG